MGRPGVGEVEHGGDEGGAKVRVDSAEVGEGVAVGEFEDGEVEIGGGDEVDVASEKAKQAALNGRDG